MHILHCHVSHSLHSSLHHVCELHPQELLKNSHMKTDMLCHVMPMELRKQLHVPQKMVRKKLERNLNWMK